MARKEAKTGQEPKPEELKPTTLLDFMSRFNLDGMKTVRFITRNPFHLGSHQVMLSLATDEFLGNVTAPHTFMLQPAEQKALKGQLKEAVGITAEGTAVSTVSGYSSSVRTVKDSERLLGAANYVNGLAGTEPKVNPSGSK